MAANDNNDWRQDLGAAMTKSQGRRVTEETGELNRFLTQTAMPAFEELCTELSKYGRTTQIRSSDSSATLTVSNNGEEEISYRLQGRTFPNGVLPFAEIRFRERNGLKLIRVESMVRSGAPDYSMSDISSDEIIGNFLQHYKKRVQTT